jgi:F-type H+-transporting ATPase subunit epsilon
VAPLEAFLVTPERELWSGRASMVIARGTEGEVGVLAGHAPMLIRLAAAPLRIQRDGQEDRFVVDGGFLHVVSTPEATRVDVLADGAVRVQDIDVDAARRERAEAEEALWQRPDDEAASLRLARATARLEAAEGR